MAVVGDSVAASTVGGSRWRPSDLACLQVMVVALVGLSAMAITGEPGALGEALHFQLGGWLPFFLSTQFLVLAPAIFLLEYLLPADPRHRGLDPNVAIDFFYFAVSLPTVAAIAAALSGPITDLLDEHAAWLVLDATDGWPVWLMAIAGLAIVDLGAWFMHLVKHKVPLFWRFHMIHHSQPRMNMFTANRAHPFDALLDVVVLLIPFYILFPSFTAQAANVAVVAMAKGWVERFEHANLRTNLGPLRWILVTPQSHRIHHSTEPGHWNSNYGTFFAWDRLFGTQHPDVTSYPTTGVSDPEFPDPVRWSPGHLARSFVGQMLFPFDADAVSRASTGTRSTGTPSTGTPSSGMAETA